MRGEVAQHQHLFFLILGARGDGGPPVGVAAFRALRLSVTRRDKPKSDTLEIQIGPRY